MADKVFVSPGVYTSEKDLTFVTRSVGVTTLGLVGETTQGPAFQPIFVENYDQFRSFFGGLNPRKIKDTGAPRYELPYIAKSYLSESNQLYVTRVLGYSGYDAGLAWGITLSAALDTSTVVETQPSTDYNPLISYTASTDGVITDLVSDDPMVQDFYDAGLLDGRLSFLPLSSQGTSVSVDSVYQKDGSVYNGVSFDIETIETNYPPASGELITGITSGSTIHYSGTPFEDVDNKVVALLRSRGSVDSDEIIRFNVTGSTDVGFTNVVNNGGKDDFGISGTSINGPFNYSLSFDKSKKNYISRVLGTNAQDGKTSLFVEEMFDAMFEDYFDGDKIGGIEVGSLVEYGDDFDNYYQEYQPAVTPWVVSELRGSNLLKLFRLVTISDGNAANKQFKISIQNIKLDDRVFDVVIRAYGDTDAKPNVLEAFSKCSMDPRSANFIAKKIGSVDQEFPQRSNFVLVEVDYESDISDAYPAGFLGFPIRDYQSGSNDSVQSPSIDYKQSYGIFENKRKAYLGLSNTVGIDQDFFDYKGIPEGDINMWTGLTKGFHMDINATGATIDNVEVVYNQEGDKYSPEFEFLTGNAPFTSESDVQGTDYEKIYARKFTFAPYGGFDGWDIYRTRRTNQDSYVVNGVKGQDGLLTGRFTDMALTNGDMGNTSDYYAFLEAIWTYKNPEAFNINVFATPGIDVFDNSNLVEESIEMIEQDRADSIYIVTTPDTDSAGDPLLPENVVSDLDGIGLDSNYTATYWPWVQVNDAENNVYVYMPPTRDVVRNIALTDNISFPWFAVAGVQRGDVVAEKARIKLTQQYRDTLYEGRINPVTTWATEGIKIWGNKTMQIEETALNRLNVRRLLLQARKLISAVSLRLLFEQNDDVVRNQFLSLVNPILDNIRSQRGLTDFRVTLDNSPELIDQNTLCGKIYLKPTRSLEYIKIEFNVMNTGASFDDV